MNTVKYFTHNLVKYMDNNNIIVFLILLVSEFQSFGVYSPFSISKSIFYKIFSDHTIFLLKKISYAFLTKIFADRIKNHAIFANFRRTYPSGNL